MTYNIDSDLTTFFKAGVVYSKVPLYSIVPHSKKYAINRKLFSNSNLTVSLTLIVTQPVRFFVHNCLISVYTICACMFTVRQLMVTIDGFTSSIDPDQPAPEGAD